MKHLFTSIVFCGFAVLCRADGDDEFANYTITNRPLPSHITVGVATAAYQIEGAWDLDGKGEQVWDTFVHEHPERIAGRATGDVASDSYHRYKEDVACMKEVGVNYYRFSIAWSRILPNGTIDNINSAGIDYYLRLLKELESNGIEAMVTLYHWDIPTNLEKQGGWLNPKVVDWFEDYARLCYKVFGPYVKSWVTINEPKQICHNGYGNGGFAPGIASPGVGEYICARHVLLAHAKAWRVFDTEFRASLKTRNTIVIDSDWYEPTTNSEADAIAAETKRQFVYGMYANPVIKGNWPQVMIDNVAKFSKAQGYNESRLPPFSDEEVELIKGTYDFIALNHYTSYMVSAIENDNNLKGVSWDDDAGVNCYRKSTWPTAAAGWFKIVPWGFGKLLRWIKKTYVDIEIVITENRVSDTIGTLRDQHRIDYLRIVPWGFGKLLRWIKQTYGDIEIVITENGVSDTTGTLRDQHRIDYLRSYMSHMIDAIYDGGVNLTAYTVWSIMDNFEWTQGFGAKLGMYYVNMSDPMRPRTAKDSSRYLANVIKTRCLLDSC